MGQFWMTSSTTSDRGVVKSGLQNLKKKHKISNDESDIQESYCLKTMTTALSGKEYSWGEWKRYRRMAGGLNYSFILK